MRPSPAAGLGLCRAGNVSPRLSQSGRSRVKRYVTPLEIACFPCKSRLTALEPLIEEHAQARAALDALKGAGTELMGGGGPDGEPFAKNCWRTLH
jgi:hypothetical protein